MMKQLLYLLIILLLLPFVLAGPPSNAPSTPGTGDLPGDGTEPTCAEVCVGEEFDCGTFEGCDCGVCAEGTTCEENVCVPEDLEPECEAHDECAQGEYCSEEDTCEDIDEQELSVSATKPSGGHARPIGQVNFSAAIETTLEEVTCYVSMYGLQDPADIIISEAKNTSEENITISYDFETLDSYVWRLVCEQTHQGQEYANQTIPRTLHITDKQGVLNINNDTYYPGGTIEYELTDFLGEDLEGDVTINIPGIVTNRKLVVDDKEFSGSILVPLNASGGKYTFSVVHDTIEEKQDEKDFNIIVPEPVLILSRTNTTINDSITIQGLSFLPAQEISLAITNEEGYEMTDELLSTSQGSFEYNYTTNLLGNFTIAATHTNRTSLNTTRTLYVHEETDTNQTGNETEQDPEPEPECEGCEQGGVCYPIGAILSGEYCGSNGFTAQKSDGATCSQNYECEFNQCTSGTCADTTTEPEPDCHFNSDCGPSEECDGGVCVPRTEQPTPTPTPAPPLEEESSSSMIWWIVVLVVFVGLIGGFFGFLAYEDSLDMSSAGGFVDGVKEAFGIDNTSSYTPPASNHATSAGAFSTNNLSQNKPTNNQVQPATAASHEQKAMSYIQQKRSQNYDDLTIRNALLKQGWPEEEVDGVFDKLYKQ